jgi:hypothetical protein
MHQQAEEEKSKRKGRGMEGKQKGKGRVEGTRSGDTEKG